MEKTIIELLLNECRSIIDEHNDIEKFPQSHIVKYCSSKKFDLAECVGKDSLKTWKYEKFEFCEAANSENANTSADNIFLKTDRCFLVWICVI